MELADKSNFILKRTPIFDEEKFTLLLNVNENDIKKDIGGDLEKVAKEEGFEAKSELHVTVIGFRNGEKIKERLAGMSEADAKNIVFEVRELISKTDWNFSFEAQQYHVARMYAGDTPQGGGLEIAGMREAYIQMISLPALNDFYTKLNRLLGIGLESPPPHITLYTKGESADSSKMGVGIESWNEFNRLNPKTVGEKKHSYNKIILPTRPQPDTIVAIFLLKVFGKSKYSGIENAQVDVLSDLPKGETAESIEAQGILPLDVGGSRFDHHNKNTTATQLVADDLGIASNPALAKVLAYAERDDKYGQGTISQDSLDRALGLSGLIAALNKALPKNPEKVVEYVIPLLKAHYLEERKRTEDMPREFEEKLQNKQAEVLQARHKGKKIKVVFVESDSPSLTGWLRSAKGPKADVVVQKNENGYVNITSRQMKRIDLRWTAALLRQGELDARARGIKLQEWYLMRAGRIDEIPEWYYDRATNSILNGSIIQKGVEPTALSFSLIKEIVIAGLEVPIEKKKRIVSVLPEEKFYFLEIRVPLNVATEIKSMIDRVPDGVKAYLPENYRIILMRLGKFHNNEMPELLDNMQRISAEFKHFSVSIDSKNFESGMVSGYSQKSFYLKISDEGGQKELGAIWNKIKSAVPRCPEQEFSPCLVIAGIIPNVDERFTANAGVVIKENARVEFPVTKIRLTQVIETLGRVSQRKRQEFVLG